MSSGNFAVVFKMQSTQDNKCYALKCFLREQEERDERYRMITDELEGLRSPYLVEVQYLPNELFVDILGAEAGDYPVLLMDWVEGVPLDQYVIKMLNSSVYDFDLFIYHFAQLARWLLIQPFAHGDLKPDNICVREDGSLVLIDYDGMFVPAMRGMSAIEAGSPHYRHPQRSVMPFDERIDDYSISLIYLSLRAICLKKELYALYHSTEYLLLSEQDQENYCASPAFQEICKLSLHYRFSECLASYMKLRTGISTRLDLDSLICLRPLQFYQKGIEAGDARAMGNLGVYYYNGEGVAIDYIEAVRWFRKAAEAGDATAMWMLGICYEYGRGVAEDWDEAVRWYRKAAEAGNAGAMLWLGECYENGRDVAEDWDEAVRWYRKAAEAGDATAMWMLGICYEYGRGVAEDWDEAVRWYRKAAEAGDAGAMLCLGECYENGRGVAEDKVEAARWYRKADEARQEMLALYFGSVNAMKMDEV